MFEKFPHEEQPAKPEKQALSDEHHHRINNK
jgi:hypothetical protein